MKKLYLPLFLLAVIVDLVSMNAHRFMEPVGEVCYYYNTDRFYNITQSIHVAILIGVIAIISNGWVRRFARPWFGFALASVINELLFNNWGDAYLEWGIFVFILFVESAAYRFRKRDQGKNKKGEAQGG